MKTPIILDDTQGPESLPHSKVQEVGSAASRSRRVLVVDDNEDAAESLAEFAQDFGYQTKTAFDGESTIVIFDEWKPDLVFLDIGLPDIDGYELAQKLRGRHTAPFTLIALTGYGQESDRRRACEAGFDRHLVKPPSIDIVVEILEGLDIGLSPSSGLRA